VKEETPQYVGTFRIGMHPLDLDLGSQTNHDIARGWLADCCEKHRACPDSNILPVMPSRVLEVGTVSSPMCRLVHTRGRKGHYVALSHCWGGPISPVLNKDTLEPFQQEIPLSSLPANFQDAVIITRELSIRYLWIDSLCIVQDSAKDWEAESAVMGDIYRLSLVTISALKSPHSRAGILVHASYHSYDASGDNPATSWLPVSDGDPTKTVLVQEPCHVDQLGLVFKIKLAPLLCRGWTLQESILPARQLYYGSQQIYWRCLRASEEAEHVRASFQSADGSSSPAACFPDETDGYPALSTALHPPDGNLGPHDSAFQTALLADFRDLIQDFTKRALTVDTDMLPAISGIVQALDICVNGQYLAGLWSNDLPLALLWVASKGRDEPSARRELGKRRGAPSWSWASSSCPIEFLDAGGLDIPPDARGPELQLVSHGVLPREGSKNNYGPAAEGSWIRLCGITTRLFVQQQLPSEEERSAVGVVRLDEYPRAKDREVFIMPSGYLYYKDNRRAGSMEYLALLASGATLLLLEKANDQVSVVYRRVGVIQFYERCLAECVRYLQRIDVSVI
jgi:hypothetical protein